MGCYAEIAGSMKVKDTPEARAKLQELLKRADGMDQNEIDVFPMDDGVIEISVCISGFCSYGTASDIDSAIEEFSPLVEEGAFFDSKCDDGQDGYVLVGSEEQKNHALSLRRCDEADALLPFMQKPELEWLRQEIENRLRKLKKGGSDG